MVISPEITTLNLLDVLMIILGCDPSITGFGWTVHDTLKTGRERLIDHGVIKTTAKSNLMPWRYRTLRESFREILSRHPTIAFAGIEHPPYGASYSMGLYALYMDVWEAFLDHRISFVYFLPTQLKAYAREVLDVTGKLTKKDMVDSYKSLLNDEWDGRMDHNMADAGIVGHMGGRFASYLRHDIAEADLTAYESKLFVQNTMNRRTGSRREEGIIYNEGEKGRYMDLQASKYDSYYV